MSQAPCPDCGGRSFTFDQAAGLATCLCGLQQPLRRRPGHQSPSAGGGAEAPKKKVSKPANKVHKWLDEVAKQLGGVPGFVVKDAARLYSCTLKDTDRKGCSEFGLALAALEHAMGRVRLGRDRADLCSHSGQRVGLKMLEACARVVARQARP